MFAFREVHSFAFDRVGMIIVGWSESPDALAFSKPGQSARSRAR